MRNQVSRRLLYALVGFSVLAAGGIGAYFWVQNEKSSEEVQFCWKASGQKTHSEDPGSIEKCGSVLASTLTGRGERDSVATHEPLPRTEKQRSAFRRIVMAYAERTSNDPTRMPPAVREKLAASATYFPNEIAEILRRGGPSAEGKEDTGSRKVHVPRASLVSFLRAVAVDRKGFEVVYKSQVKSVSKSVGELDKNDFLEKPSGQTDKARTVVENAGSIVGSMAKIRSGAISKPAGEDGKAKNKDKLVENYEEYGYPRLRDMIQGRAQKVGVPESQMTNTGGRMGDIMSAAESSYNAA